MRRKNDLWQSKNFENKIKKISFYKKLILLNKEY